MSDNEDDTLGNEHLDPEDAAAVENSNDAAALFDAAEAALVQASSRVRDLRRLNVSSKSSSQQHQQPLLEWAAQLTSHVTDGLREAVKAASSTSTAATAATTEDVCNCKNSSSQISRISLLQLAVDGFQSTAACYVACTEGYSSDSGGQIFDATSTKTFYVEPRPLPASCVAVLMLRQRKKNRIFSSRIVLIPTKEHLNSVLLTTQTILHEVDERPLRMASSPEAAQLFLLTTTRRKRLHVRQCGLDGVSVQSVELKDFRRSTNINDRSADDSSSSEDAAEAQHIDHRGCYEDVRIEADAKHIVVFQSGSKASLLRNERTVVVLLDCTSLRVVQRLQLPQGSWTLHATPRLVWLRHAGQLKLVSQASRRVGRDWMEVDCFGPGGLFYSEDAAEIVANTCRDRQKVRLAVASENCVRLFDKEMQTVGRIRLRHPVAICCAGTAADDGQVALLAVCDGAAHEVLLVRL